MSEFHKAFARFQQCPTSDSLGTFASQMEMLSKMTKKEEMKRMLIEALKDIRGKEEYDDIRADEGVLRLYSLLGNVSQQLGTLGIYKQMEKDGTFVNSLKFHLQWATELAKKADMAEFDKVLCLARDRFEKTMSMSEIEAGFRDLADEYLKDDFHHLFKNPDDTMNLFDPRFNAKSNPKKARRRSSVCQLRMHAPVNKKPQNLFGANTRCKLRSEFIDTDEEYGVSIEEFRMALMRDEMGEGLEKNASVAASYRRKDSGIVHAIPTTEEVQFAKEAVENRMAQKRKKNALSVVEEGEDDMESDDKKSRLFSPLTKTDNANRVPIRQAIPKEDIPTTITLSSDTKNTSNSELSFNGNTGDCSLDNEKLNLMAAGKKNSRQSANTITNGSVFSDTKTAKTVAGISMMAENNCHEAHALFSDTVHLDRDNTVVLDEDVARNTMTNTMASHPSNKTVDFSVYCDPTIVVEQEPTRVRSTSSGTGLNVVYDAEEENEDEEKEDDEEVKEGKKESAVVDDYLEPQTLRTPPSNSTCVDFDDSIVSGFERRSGNNIVTSTPANVVPFVAVEEFFGNTKSIEPKNEDKVFAFPSVPSSLHQKMMRRKSVAPKEVMKAEVKVVQKPDDESISEQFGRRLSLGANEAAKIQEQAEETGIKNRRRSEIIKGDINPWDEDLRKKLMKMVNPPTNMHEFQEISPKIQAMKEIEAGGERFKIQTLIGQGGYAKVYRATNEDNKVVAVKYEVPSCAWEVFVCDQMKIRLLRDNKERSKKIAEYCIMTVMDAYIFTNASLLVNEYHEYGTLLEYANNLKDPNWHLSCYLINQAATIIKEVHDVGIIHGDIKPDNFIITRKIDANWTKDQLLTADCFVIKLIDWGRAIDMMTLKGRKFVGKAGTEGFDCPEMNDGRPWTFQTDYFGFAASVAVLMTGKYASLNGTSLGNYSLKTDIKRRNELRDVVWQMIDSFLNIRSCSELPGWNTTIDALSETWASKFESIVWRQSVAKFNESCDAAKK